MAQTNRECERLLDVLDAIREELNSAGNRPQRIRDSHVWRLLKIVDQFADTPWRADVRDQIIAYQTAPDDTLNVFFTTVAPFVFAAFLDVPKAEVQFEFASFRPLHVDPETASHFTSNAMSIWLDRT